MDVLRKRISCNEASDENVSNVVPVGIIAPENKDGQNIKIVIVPLDIKNQGTEALAKTLIALEELRTHAHEIDAFTNKMIDDYRHEIEIGTAKDQKQGQKNVSLDQEHVWKHFDDAIGNQTVADEKQESAFVEVGSLPQADVAPNAPNPSTIPSLPNTPNTKPTNPNNVPSPTPQTQPNVLPLGDPQRTQIFAKDADAYLDSDLITIEVPPSLNKHLNDLAISSMQLSFEMNMTDVRNAILYGDEILQKTQPTLGEDAIVSFGTIVEADPHNKPELTVPLQFNVLISGNVNIDIDKLEVEQLTDNNLPNYQDSVTSIAANICGTALQKNLAALGSEAPVQNMELMPDQNSTKAQMDLQNKQAVIHGKDGCKHPILKPKKKCKKPPCKLDDPCYEDKCKPPKEKPNKPSAENTTQTTASAQNAINASVKKGASGGYSRTEPTGTGGSGAKFNTYSTKAGTSTTSSFYKPNRSVCSTCVSAPKLPSFKIYSTLIQRNFCEGTKSKCSALGGAERPQVDKKALKGPRTDCVDPGAKPGETVCPKPAPKRATACTNVKFPRKKCAKDEPIREPPSTGKKPIKKFPPICMVNKKKGEGTYSIIKF